MTGSGAKSDWNTGGETVERCPAAGSGCRARVAGERVANLHNVDGARELPIPRLKEMAEASLSAKDAV